MRIAIVGSGISGLICGHLLGQNHNITLFESDSRPGGHVNTVSTSGTTGTYNVDTGFIVFNRENYPNFVRLLEKLEVPTHETRMGFSVRSEISGLSTVRIVARFVWAFEKSVKPLIGEWFWTFSNSINLLKTYQILKKR